MFGTHYLVEPIYTYQDQVTSCIIYLPKFDPGNLKWQHYFIKQIYQGEQHYIIPTILNDFSLLPTISSPQ